MAPCFISLSSIFLATFVLPKKSSTAEKYGIINLFSCLLLLYSGDHWFTIPPFKFLEALARSLYLMDSFHCLSKKSLLFLSNTLSKLGVLIFCFTTSDDMP